MTLQAPLHPPLQSERLISGFLRWLGLPLCFGCRSGGRKQGSVPLAEDKNLHGVFFDLENAGNREVKFAPLGKSAYAALTIPHYD